MSLSVSEDDGFRDDDDVKSDDADSDDADSDDSDSSDAVSDDADSSDAVSDDVSASFSSSASLLSSSLSSSRNLASIHSPSPPSPPSPPRRETTLSITARQPGVVRPAGPSSASARAAHSAAVAAEARAPRPSDPDAADPPPPGEEDAFAFDPTSDAGSDASNSVPSSDASFAFARRRSRVAHRLAPIGSAPKGARGAYASAAYPRQTTVDTRASHGVSHPNPSSETPSSPVGDASEAFVGAPPSSPLAAARRDASSTASDPSSERRRAAATKSALGTLTRLGNTSRLVGLAAKSSVGAFHRLASGHGSRRRNPRGADRTHLGANGDASGLSMTWNGSFPGLNLCGAYAMAVYASAEKAAYADAYSFIRGERAEASSELLERASPRSAAKSRARHLASARSSARASRRSRFVRASTSSTSLLPSRSSRLGVTVEGWRITRSLFAR